MPCPPSTLGDVNADIQNYLSLSVAASTRKTYSSGERRFLDFCTLHSPHKPIPTDEETLIQYVAYLAKTIKHSSIKGYLAAVRHLHICSGYDLNLKKFIRLQLVCRGMKRSQGDSSRIRLPITITHLKLFFQLLAIPNTTSYDSIMLWAAMTLAFFGFLRLGEMTCNSPFSPALHLSPCDITFLPNFLSPEHMSVRIKVSKTDPFRSGQGRLPSQYAPSGLCKFFCPPGGPQLVHIFSIYPVLLSQKRVLHLKLGSFSPCLVCSPLNTRDIGAATTSASVGLPPWLIKTLGRWYSDCYERYIQCPHSLFSGVSCQLLTDKPN